MAQTEGESHSLKYDGRAYADLAALDPYWQDEVLTAIAEKLRQRPEVFGKPLRQSLKGCRSLRVGDYRVVFRINKETVYVLGVIHRSAGYGRMEGRL